MMQSAQQAALQRRLQQEQRLAAAAEEEFLSNLRGSSAGSGSSGSGSSGTSISSGTSSSGGGGSARAGGGRMADTSAVPAHESKYVPHRNSVKDTRRWEADTGKRWLDLDAREREAASAEITRLAQS